MRFRARGKRPQPKAGMNGTEKEYAWLLEQEKQMGTILDYKFEPLKLRLADRTFYTPDFLVITSSLEVHLREVKGFWEDDARVKIKVAAEQYPYFTFQAFSKKAKRDGGGWKMEEF